MPHFCHDFFPVFYDFTCICTDVPFIHVYVLWNPRLDDKLAAVAAEDIKFTGICCSSPFYPGDGTI